eukprot:GFUD01043225.1.p1 GENE.GFUD01043225.1~~GFUD01043225.1.p1  ORF type:complete len:450 (+),score=115.12 GFUD01043225.1:98-1447(+)
MVHGQEEEQQGLLSGEQRDNRDSQDHVEGEDYVEGGWGWVVVLASFLCVCVLDGIGYSFGVFLEPLLADLGEGRGVLSMAGSMQVGVYGFSSPVVARIINKYGERRPCMVGAVISAAGLLVASYATGIWTLLLGYSVITGLGFGLMYLPSVVIVSKHFLVRRSLATGIVLCAAGVGTFIMAPLAQLMMEQWGWRGSMRGLAGLCLGCVLCGAAMSPGTVSQETKDGPGVGLTGPTVDRPCLAKVLGSDLANSAALPVFFLLALGDMLATLSLYIPYTHLPSAAMATGVSASHAALLVSAIGVTNTLGRLTAGWMCDQPWSHPIVIITTVISCSVPFLYLFSIVASFWFFLFFSCSFGFLTGMWVSATPGALIHLLGLPLLGPTFALLTAARGCAALGGPPLAGMVVDLLGDRAMALVMAGGVMTLSSLFYAVSAVANKRREDRRSYEEI